jgi:hypothetical protein
MSYGSVLTGEEMTMEPTRDDMRIADRMAQEMAAVVDASELKKIVSYVERFRDPARCLELLQRLPESGFARTGRTRGYYRAILQSVERHLRDVEGERFVAILAWSERLLRYYQVGKPKPGQRPRRQRGERRR